MSRSALAAAATIWPVSGNWLLKSSRKAFSRSALANCCLFLALQVWEQLQQRTHCFHGLGAQYRLVTKTHLQVTETHRSRAVVARECEEQTWGPHLEKKHEGENQERACESL